MSDNAVLSDEQIMARVDAVMERLNGLVTQVEQDLPQLPSSDEMETSYNAGIDAMEQERWDEALDVFGNLAALQPGNPRYQFGFALCLQQFGKMELAGEYYSLAYTLDPSNAACAFRLGECLAACGHTVEAQEALRTAIQLTELPETDPQIRVMAESLLDQLA
jgi:type III secretion system low calcium response chaperone LcrH/SycD